MVRLVIGRWRPQFGADLEGHVRAEEAARQAGDARVSIRLAGEFHTRLGEMAGNTLLRRYLERSGVALLADPGALRPAAFGRLRRQRTSRDRRGLARRQCRGRRSKIMDHHLGSVEQRALLDQGRDAGFDLGAVLSRYAEALDGARFRQGRAARQTEGQGKAMITATPALAALLTARLPLSFVHIARGLRRGQGWSIAHDHAFIFRAREPSWAAWPQAPSCCPVSMRRRAPPTSPSASSMSARVPTTAGTRPMRWPPRR